MPTMTIPPAIRPIIPPQVKPTGDDAAATSAAKGNISIRDFDFFYGKSQALYGISMEIPARQVTALIGPSGCGKSTLLRNINRMNDLIDGISHRGDISIDGKTIYNPHLEVTSLRKRIGMVFQKSNPFPRSIYENVAYGPRILGEKRKAVLEGIVEKSLRGAALWDEVKDRLHESAYGLSGGQQQRLCIARTTAVEPSIILMDEPCSALDPIATARVEELILGLKESYTIVMVTHNMQQASRVSDRTAFFYLGGMVEYDLTSRIFTNPTEQRTEDYISGRFG